MNKKHIRFFVTLGILIIMAVTLGIYQQLRTTTYEKVLSDIISENKDIEQITIRYCNPKEKAENDKTMTLKDQSDITKIVKQPKDMPLKRTWQENNRLYLIEFKITEERPRMLIVNDQDTLTITSSSKTKDNYQIKGQNHLVETIETNEGKWEPIAKDTGSIESGSLYLSCP